MEIKFFSAGKVMDLSGQKLSISESNSKVSDKLFTKYIFPFEFYMDEEFKKSFGDYASFDSFKLPKILEGYMLYENNYNKAKLEFGTVEGDYITCQIDFGFDEIPNFDKPLKDLPLEKFGVANIHTFAAEVCEKKYPQTNFNFPRLYNNQYSTDDGLWDAFNGFVNDMNDDGSAFRNNYVTENGDIYNINIIHPMPHILYLLNTGFKDAGYNLGGEILSDAMLQQVWVYSGTEYFSRLTLRRLGLNISTMEYYDTLANNTFGLYDSSLVIPKVGSYRLIAKVNLSRKDSLVSESRVDISFNNNRIFYRSTGSEDSFTFETDIVTLNTNEQIRVQGGRSVDFTSNTNFIELELVSKNTFENEESQTEDNGVITNRNEIDLSRAVPDITFGELVNRLRNFLNYDINIDGSNIIMDKIKKPDAKNIKVLPQKFLELEPRMNILNKKSFILQMPAWENDEKPDSIYFDSNGIQINNKGNDSSTIIETNTYVLPVYVAKNKGQETGVIKSYNSSLLQLVKYEGKSGIQNNAKSAPELTFPALFFSNWIDWLRGRLNSIEFDWDFIVEDDDLFVKIKDEIGAYQNIHIITEWIKDHSENSLQVTIKTETFN